jgi:hypothetical protein
LAGRLGSGGLDGMGTERTARVRRRLAQSRACLCLGLLVSAWAILQAQEFQQAVDQLSQAEVVARWGPPQAIVAGAEGQALWSYTVRAHACAQPGGILGSSPSWVLPGGWRCTQYLFRFDRMQV